MGGVAVTFAVTDGSGSASGGAATTNASGVATVGSWTLSTTAGANVMTASAGSLPSVTFSATGTADAPATLEKIAASENQSAIVNTTVPVAPGVVVRDQHGNPVAGATVTFAVSSGSGSVGAGTGTTNGLGVATVGSWTLGAVGENTLTASVTGLAAAVFTATGLEPSPVSVDGITPATLSPGGTMTISGAGFSATPNQNTVTIDGVTGTVTTASATELTVILPGSFACEPLRNVPVVVTVAGNIGARQHPLRVATARSLAVGESLVLATPADARCNELANSGGRYFVTVFNASSTYTPTGAPFQLRGAAGTASPGPGASANSAVAPAPARRTTAGESLREQTAQRVHDRILQENIQFLRRNRHRINRPGGTTGPAMNAVPGEPRRVVVGDIVPIRLPKAQRSGFCTNYQEISTRVAYAGTRAVILEDVANPLAGEIDSTYASIGQEFDATMFPLLEQYYGNPLAMDVALSNTGKVHMVFTKVLNDSVPGIAGFVVGCDFFPRQQFPSSNVGQYFYAISPTIAGTNANVGTPPRWRWTMRSTIIHEAKHITSFAERIARNSITFEEQWLEESTARLSEELYERARYGFTQSSNILYGAASMSGPWCGVRLTSCATQQNQPRGFVRTFEDLHTGFYPESPSRSPIGRLNENDFSFYATGWSLVRWTLDHTTGSEAEFIRALTQSETRSGIANLEFNAGRPFADMLPEWLLAMALDDRAGITVSNPRVNFPSWSIRDVFAGLNQDFPTNYTSPFPLATWQLSYGTFMVNSAAVPATGVFAEISGVQSDAQLLELRSGPGVAAPAELRMAIVRIQ